MEGLLSIGEYINSFISELSSFVWGFPLIVILVGTHIFLTIRTGFVQRKIFTAIKLSTSRDNAKGEVSQFGALVVALAATIGTGNIIGVGTAISMGGPGAVFWCWIVGFLGVATKYSETLLAVKFRTKTTDGRIIGGAMVVLDKVMHKHWLSVLFCMFTLLASLGIGNMCQANSLSELVACNMNVPTYMTGLLLAFIVGVIIIGGVKWVSKVCEFVVPFMALFYIVACIILLCFNYNYIWPAIQTIMVDAFTIKSVSGGFAGGGMILAMRYGISRGLFSNESGMGSAPLVASQAQTKNSVRQALISSSGTFWDTVVLCAVTGLVMVSSVLAYPDIDYSNGASLTSMAFGKLHQSGSVLLTIALFFFVFSTILGWACYGERVLEYWLGVKAIKYYRAIWPIFVFVGSVVKLDFVWNFSDLSNALMAIPNIVMMLALSGIIASETRKYLWNKNLDAPDTEMVS